MLHWNIETWTFLVIAAFLIVLYFSLMRIHRKNRLERQSKVRCKELILDNRQALVSAGVDLEGLISLIKLEITPEQLERVISLLMVRRERSYPAGLDNKIIKGIELDLEDSKPQPRPEKITAGKNSTETEPAVNQAFNKMSPEQEKTWLKVAHNRFRRALADKGITEKRARLKLLVKMVELGKKAVEDNPEKNDVRKEYECLLWDRFYKNEYLELNS
ncbi:MAG: hypothetical protein U9N45_03840 [Gemmatimonadota bacterium]|nr:hypothetical protein [Gemmatimonadota bacterium]